MDNKINIDKNDKKLIIIYTIKEMLIYMLIIILMSIIILFGLSKISNEFKNFALLFLGLIITILLLIIVFKILTILASSNMELTDGYIYKTRFYNDVDRGSIPYGKAITLDESKTTGEQRLPYDFMYGNDPDKNKIPVKILIQNNSATKFFITKESYNYVKENRGQLHNRFIKIKILVFIVLAIIMLFYFINFINY